jgi:hypothetical protein
MLLLAYRIITVPQEHRSMQNPEVDLSPFDNKVTLIEPNALGSRKLNKVDFESLL